MKILLDTHVFLWWESNSKNLPVKIFDLIEDPENLLLLSVASVWEIQIKVQIGKLHLAMPIFDIIENQRTKNAIQILPILLEHVLALPTLPKLHKDPFDRILIAQTVIENAALVSSDSIFVAYPVRVIWN